MPPPIATYARHPASGRPNRSVDPAGASAARHLPIGTESMVALRSAPAIEISVGASNSSAGPINVVSSAAAPSSFPTSRFAMRSAIVSIAPHTGTAWRCVRGLPRSWTVVWSPPLTTRALTTVLGLETNFETVLR